MRFLALALVLSAPLAMADDARPKVKTTFCYRAGELVMGVPVTALGRCGDGFPPCMARSKPTHFLIPPTPRKGRQYPLRWHNCPDKDAKYLDDPN